MNEIEFPRVEKGGRARTGRGFVYCVPSPRYLLDGGLMEPWSEIDKEIAEKYPCEECGAPMKYEPRYERDAEVDKWGDKAVYHAFAVCTNPECRNECEF